MPSSAIEDNPNPAESAAPSFPATLRARGEFYPLAIRAIQHEIRDAAILVFDVPPELQEVFTFVQGQYLTLRANIDGESIRRSYSICSAVQDGMLRVGIKRAPGGLFSNWILNSLKTGDTLEVMPPMGSFHVPLAPEHAGHYVAFAVGSGITPIFSIIKTTLLTEPHSTFTLFYGNRSSSSVILREELADLKDRFLGRFVLIHIMSREHQDVDLLNGRITGERSQKLLQQFCRLNGIDMVFLCGPREMVEDVAGRLHSTGFPASQIKIEHFSAKEAASRVHGKAPASVDRPICHVTLVLDGGRRSFSMVEGNETVLDAALRAGIDVRYSCKSGVCATCRAKVVSGQVDMDANYALEDYEVARGFVLTCQSYPVSEELTVDFDQDT